MSYRCGFLGKLSDINAVNQARKSTIQHTIYTNTTNSRRIYQVNKTAVSDILKRLMQRRKAGDYATKQVCVFVMKSEAKSSLGKHLSTVAFFLRCAVCGCDVVGSGSLFSFPYSRRHISQIALTENNTSRCIHLGQTAPDPSGFLERSRPRHTHLHTKHTHKCQTFLTHYPS